LDQIGKWFNQDENNRRDPMLVLDDIADMVEDSSDEPNAPRALSNKILDQIGEWFNKDENNRGDPMMVLDSIANMVDDYLDENAQKNQAN
jgi:isochorismate synthase EntC